MVEDYVTVDGVVTHYVVSGSGSPLVLVHGWGGSWITYRHNIAELAEEHRVYAVDLPGNGGSGFPEGADFSAETGGEFISRFLEQVVREPAALAGVSAGGLLCALAAARRPDLVSHLILISSAGLGRNISWGLRLVTLPGLDPFVGQPTPGSVRLALSQQIFDQSLVTDELVAALCEDRRAPGNRLALLRGLRSNISLLGVKRWRRHFRAVSRLAMPVLIVWGRQDKLIPVRHAYRGLRAISGARLKVFDRCGHLPPYERPQEFNRAVREFLA
ncbi:MAG: alpha/beta fold hydrolase [Solirubrobacteraceae bacterium]